MLSNIDIQKNRKSRVPRVKHLNIFEISRADVRIREMFKTKIKALKNLTEEKQMNTKNLLYESSKVKV